MLYLDKFAEKLLSELIISDMKKKLPPSQYANQKVVAIQHYLIKVIAKILTSLDTSLKPETCAVLATLFSPPSGRTWSCFLSSPVTVRLSPPSWASSFPWCPGMLSSNKNVVFTI